MNFFLLGQILTKCEWIKIDVMTFRQPVNAKDCYFFNQESLIITNLKDVSMSLLCYLRTSAAYRGSLLYLMSIFLSFIAWKDPSMNISLQPTDAFMLLFE